ncbi:MAG: N-acetylmuramoyl-L-alanine amidase [Candidatus Riflebacteria bacterium]|nr:N-acetylmuramoyl-L-alanine amidase [Candidatus Riflebacteria bacterium]
MSKNKIILVSLLFLFLTHCLSAFASSEQRITDIRFWQSPEEAQVVLDLSQPPRVSEVNRLNNGTLSFDIKSCIFKPGKQRYALQNQFLETLTVQQNEDTGSTSILFRVPRGVEAKTFVLPSNERKGDRIVIFLKEPQANILKKQTAELNEVKRLKAENIKIVVLDPGHGGEDPGTTCNGIVEKSYVLAMAKLVKAYFDRDPRYKAILTRESDYIIPLDKRREIAERLGADAFVSIHVNWNVKKAISGIEVYYESPKGAVNEADRLVADKENKADFASLGVMSPVITASKNQIAQMQANIMDQSRQLAEKVEYKLAKALPTIQSRGVKRAGFRVLHSLNMPSILVEYGYTSNKYDSDVLKDYTSRTKLAQSLYAGISNFLQTKVEGGIDAEYLEYYKAMNAKKAKLEAEKKKKAAAKKNAKNNTAKSKTNTKSNAKAPKKYTVKHGDTLSAIAQKYGVTIQGIKTANKMKKSDVIKSGQVLIIPAK